MEVDGQKEPLENHNQEPEKKRKIDTPSPQSPSLSDLVDGALPTTVPGTLSALAGVTEVIAVEESTAPVQPLQSPRRSSRSPRRPGKSEASSSHGGSDSAARKPRKPLPPAHYDSLAGQLEDQLQNAKNNMANDPVKHAAL